MPIKGNDQGDKLQPFLTAAGSIYYLYNLYQQCHALRSWEICRTLKKAKFGFKNQLALGPTDVMDLRL